MVFSLDPGPLHRPLGIVFGAQGEGGDGLAWIGVERPADDLAERNFGQIAGVHATRAALRVDLGLAQASATRWTAFDPRIA